MNKLKFVSPLTGEQRAESEEIKGCGIFPERVANRARCILLSDRKFTIKEISDIFQVYRETVSAWINKREQEGPAGLADKPGKGRKPVLTKEEQGILKRLILENPRSSETVAEKQKKETGKSISCRSVKIWAKKFGMKWKRARKSLKLKRNNDDFEKAKRDIEAFEKQKEKGDIDVVYFDGAGFNLTPCVPYAWQLAGRENTIGIPSARSKGINALSFLSSDNRIYPYLFENTINSAAVTACFDDFADQISKLTVAVLDNAPMHTGKEFYSNIEKWQEKGLFPYFIPSYSPELNLIEILWKKIKYEWLPFSAYESIEKLKKEIETILIEYGSKYIINFS